MKYENLHTHTITSDGKMSYKETLDVCLNNNIGITAFTDHDSIISPDNLDLLQKLNHETKWISGVEMSSGTPIELGGKPTSSLHIVGLFVNPLYDPLIDHCKRMQEARVERMEKMVKNLQSLGFKITVDACLMESKGETVNRPHIVSALIKKGENNEIIKELVRKLERESKDNKELNDIYQEMLENGENRYSYRLFLDSNSYIKDVYVDYLYGLDLDKTVELIRLAGGVSILAHYTYAKKIINPNLLGELLKDKRIDGVEVVYNPFQAKGVKQDVFDDMNMLDSLSNKYNALKSGGADSHKREDILDFFSNQNLAEKTIGLTNQILDKSGIEIDKQVTSVLL